MHKLGTEILVHIQLNDGHQMTVSIDTLCFAYTLAVTHRGKQVGNIKALRMRDKGMTLKGANSLLHSLEEANDIEIRDILEELI